ncbi:MAG: hypothetical protein ABSD08_20795 [Xanthobacteraceae bacterium]|jgi:hypothetical protein
MAWKRLGLVHVPDGTKSWARSHAALPVPVRIERDIYRVFFSTRDATKRSSVGWVDVDLSSTPRVLREASDPALSPGEDGAFDDSGIGIGCFTPADDGVRLYYMGWNLGVRGAWRNAIGLALVRPALDLCERFSAGPILDRSPEDPYTLSYPWVLRRGPQDWWMWYGSNLTPDTSSIGMRHSIKVARSQDGIHWNRDGAAVIDFATNDEHAIARPTVVEADGRLLMLFACRGEQYRIGAATSTDGETWTRIDAIMGLHPSAEGWDSQMTCYPAIFRHRDRLWFAYNGNGYGATGFGFAVWEGEIPSNGPPKRN